MTEGSFCARVEGFVGGVDRRPDAGAEQGPVDFGDEQAVVGEAVGAGEGAQEGAFADGVEGSLEIFGGAAAVDVEMMGEGMEAQVAGEKMEEAGEGVGFEVDAGGAGDLRLGILDEAGADGIEKAEIFAVIPDAPFAAVDGMSDFEEVDEGVGAVEGEGDHLAPAFGFADGAAVLHEGEGDGVALAMEVQGLVEGPVPGVGILVVVETEEKGKFFRALQADEEFQSGGPRWRVRRRGSCRWRHRRGRGSGSFASAGRDSGGG